jgi:drug/metabolite transporter (DMT)-like permease
MPFTRIAVSTGHPPLGLLLWQQVVLVLAIAPAAALRRPDFAALRGRADLVTVIALFGAVLPGYVTYVTAVDIPAGVRSVIIAIVPMFVLPLALAVGLERPDPRRGLGVLLGAVAVAILARPEAGLPAAVGLGTLFAALLAPLSYAVESTYLSRRGQGTLDPLHLLLAASVLSLALVAPIALAYGQAFGLARAWGPAEWAMLGSGLLNAAAYVGYVWLIGRTGALFASQIAYVVTAFGVLWSMALLGERYSLAVWGAMALILAGLALVQPRPPRETA